LHKEDAMIDELIHKINKQQSQLEELKSLGNSVLLKNPSDNGWCIAECLAHMNLAMEIYLDQFESMKDRLQPEKNAYKPAFLVNQLIQSQPPDKKGKIRFKISTMKRLDPRKTGKPADRSVIERQERNLSRLLQFLESMKGKDTRSFKVETVLGPIIKLYAGDAAQFITAHNERHFKQIRNILEKTGVQA
ncbi:MAG: DinB family protein, partial [Cyclobacteriaceae bacterium]